MLRMDSVRCAWTPCGNVEACIANPVNPAVALRVVMHIRTGEIIEDNTGGREKTRFEHERRWLIRAARKHKAA
jgi:hypothetical protein